jgi:hypothetical protein
MGASERGWRWTTLPVSKTAACSTSAACVFADIDGSVSADIVYLGSGSCDMNRNLAGNGWADATRLVNVPHFDQLSSVAAVGLLGNGTSCLVWSTSRPADARRSMLYLDLMGGQKPHLLTRFAINLGCETRITYAPLTQLYLQDRQEGRQWVTHLQFFV